MLYMKFEYCEFFTKLITHILNNILWSCKSAENVLITNRNLLLLLKRYIDL